tara:strand:- start:1251 stop:1736 length:486 start_codon:yes stop_codon:yes gene_type:complete
MDLPKSHKYDTIYNWKNSGVKYDDFESLYLTYINTMECQHCHKVFKNNTDRCLDHCHETGKFRKIVCRACNIHDNYIRFPDGVPSKNERVKIYRDNNKDKESERHKIYRHDNKDKIKEADKIYRDANKDKLTEKIKCDCGGKYIHTNKARHFKTKKHLAFI